MFLRFAFTLIIGIMGVSYPSWSCDFLISDKDVFYYKFQRDTPLPEQFTQWVKPLYFKTYNPTLHEGYSPQDMGLEAKFKSYEEFLFQLIDDDFKLYATTSERDIFFATKKQCLETYENVCGFCVFLPDNLEGDYYLDHIGIKDTCARQGIGHHLLNLAIDSLAAKVVTLDTRIFNTPGQNFYEKEGFTKISPHPTEKKEGRYLRYIKRI